MHVAITGASSGIGEALAREFAEAGASISLIARRKDLLDKIASHLKTRTFIKNVDLLDYRNAAAWIADAEAALGPIDVLINNAGMQVVGPTDEMSPEKGEAVINLNLLTPLRLTQALLPAMIARGSGTIVDIASMAALAPMPGMHHYNAAKAGIAAASEALRGELRGTGVHVVTVYPGPITTAMAEASFEKYGESARRSPTGTTQGLARLVRRAVERKRARVIYPRVYAISRHLPNLTRFLVDRLTPKLARAAGKTGLMVGAALASAALAPSLPSHAAEPARPLFQRLGGKPGINRIADAFVDALSQDQRLLQLERVKEISPRLDRKRAKARVADELCKAAGGPCKPVAAPLGKGLPENLDLNLGAKEWFYVVQDAGDAMDRAKVPAKEQGELLALLLSQRNQPR